MSSSSWGLDQKLRHHSLVQRGPQPLGHYVSQLIVSLYILCLEEPTRNSIPQFVGCTEDVLGLLKGNGVLS